MSSEEWKKYRLGELREITSSKRIYYSEYKSEGVPFFRSKEIIEKHNGNNVSTKLYLSPQRYEEIKEKFGVPKRDDLLLTSVGTLGIPFLIETDEEFYFKDGNLTWFKDNGTNLLLSKYLYYWLICPTGKQELEKRKIGTTQQALTIEALKKVEIKIPSIPTQEYIIEMLTGFDDKIELNCQTNATLEATAQAIFKEWFVDFNYPGATGELVESELGPIPKGWRVGRLQDISETIDCLHSKKPERVQEKTDHLLLQLWNILDSGHIDLKDPYWISQKDYLKWISRIEAMEGDSVITNVGRSGVAARIPASLKAALGRNMTAIRVRRDFPFDVYLIILLKSPVMAKEIEGQLDPGTIMDSLNVRSIPMLRFVRPPIEMVAEFEEIIKPIWIKTDENIVECALLERVRDLLLPKLMSGEIEA